MNDTQAYVMLNGDGDITGVEAAAMVHMITRQEGDVILHEGVTYKKVYDDNGSSIENVPWNYIPVSDGSYIITDNAAHVKYELALKTDESIAADIATRWTAVRETRDALLKSTDWVTVRSVDVGTPVPELWAAYRQSLRDITTQDNPFDLTWPTPPE